MAQALDWREGEKYLAKIEPTFAKLIDQYGHCTLKPVKPERYYATLIKGILAQQVASDISQNLFAAFSSLCGPEPTAQEVLLLPREALQKCGISEQKIQYIFDLSQNIAENKITPQNFDELEDATIIKQLANVRGLGRWTAEIFLILALSRPDVLPADDFGLKKAAMAAFSLAKLPQKRNELTGLAEPWRPWRSLATWYLWQSFADLK